MNWLLETLFPINITHSLTFFKVAVVQYYLFKDWMSMNSNSSSLKMKQVAIELDPRLALSYLGPHKP